MAESRGANDGGLSVQYGLNLLLYTATFTKDDVGLISRVAEMGYDGVEIPFMDLGSLAPQAIRGAAKKAGVGLTSCCVLPPGASLCSEDESERENGVEMMSRMVELTAEMGGDVMGGPLYSPVGEIKGRWRTEDEWKWCAECLSEVAEKAEQAGITIAIEPLNRFETYFLNTVEDTLAMVDEVGSPALTVQVDTFHSHIEERDTGKAIRSAAGRLGHFHASENHRGTPGTGQVRWRDAFNALKETDYNGWVTIESFAIGISDLCAAASIWRPIYDTADGLAQDGLAFLKAMAKTA